MDVKPGNKQTEVGIVPQEWAVMPLGKITSIERGKFSARPRNDPRYYGGDFPFIQTGDVTRSGGLITSFTQTLNRDGLRVSRLFPKGTLFFTIAANIGDVGIAMFEAACPDSLVAIVPIAAVEKGWLLYELARRKSDFESLASPGAQLNINLEKLRPYLVPVPTTLEQRAIATALSDVDALIAGLERLIAKKRNVKQAAMQQLLTGRTRLPGFVDEWESKLLGDHLTFLKNGVNSRAELNDASGVKYLHYGDIHGSTRVFVQPSASTMPFLPATKATKLDRLVNGDLVFADASEDLDGVGKAVEVHGVAKDELVSGMHTIAVRFDKSVLADGFKGYLQFVPLFKMQLKRLAAGTKVYATNRAHIASAELPLPDVEEQAAIAAVLSDMDAELSALESRLAKTRAIKQGMMQELLTGRTRLVNVAHETAVKKQEPQNQDA